MPVGIAASVYLSACIAAGAFLALRCFPERRVFVIRVTGVWLALTWMTFFAPSAPLFFIAVAGMLAWAAPREAPKRLAFYLAVLPAAPTTLAWQVPFPGLEHLLIVYYTTVVNAVLLLPLLGRALAGQRVLAGQSWASWALAFMILAILLDFRSTSITNGLRTAFEHGLATIVVLFATTIALRHPAGFREAVFAMALAGLLMAPIAFAQTGLSWPIYSNASGALRLYELQADMIYSYRDGLLRASGPMGSPIPYGMYMALTVTILLFQREEPMRRMWPLAGAAVAMGALLLSSSRGALLMLAVSLIVYVGFSRALRPMRTAMVVGAASIALLLPFSGALDRIAQADEHGTFAYRLELLENAQDSIRRNPVFGARDFRSDENLERSRQGQGIIDVVNAYLRIVLQYGLVGLTLFVIPTLMVIRAVMKRRAASERAGASENERSERLSLALIAGFCAAIATVSLIDRLETYYWLLLCLAAAAVLRPRPAAP